MLAKGLVVVPEQRVLELCAIQEATVKFLDLITSSSIWWPNVDLTHAENNLRRLLRAADQHKAQQEDDRGRA